MHSPRSVVMAMLAAGAGGCYMDVSAGVQHAGGGVTGYGWELALSAGVALDVVPVIRPSVAVDGSMVRNKVSDGKFGTTGLSYHGRLDVAVSGTTQISSAEIAMAHPGMAIPEGGALAITRLVLDYGMGTNEKLQFEAPGDPMLYTKHSTVHSLYLGLAREYDVSSVVASFGIGPHVTFMPNDFVGDTTNIGLQVHSSFWFAPVFRWKSSGSIWKNSSDPTPIQKGPEAPGVPKDCIDQYGNRRPC